jgi:predicted nucleic acid-binding protein
MRSPWRQSDTFTCFNSFTICFAAALRYRIFIPTAVYQELTVDPPVPGTIEVQTLQWLEVRSVSVRAMVEQLQTRAQLDLGESEAIALALEINADLLLLMSVVVEQKQTVWASGLLGC